MKLPSTSAELVYSARRKKNMNQDAFATLLGSKQSLISRYESGEIESPPADLIIRVANILLEESGELRRERRLAEQLIQLHQSGDARISDALSVIIQALAKAPIAIERG